MQFGTFNLFNNPPWNHDHDTVRNEFEQADAADRLGFQEVWLAEHNARRYGIAGDVLLIAAALARSTKNIRIGTAVTRLPLFHPLHLAENISMVDIMAGGRFDWGVGKGYDPLEFATYGVPFEEREERWTETFEAVRAIWKKRRTGFEGKFHSIPDEEFYPEPMLPEGPPVYIMCSRSDSTVEWAAKRLFPVVFGQGPDWDDVRHKMELYRRTAGEAGFEDAAVENVMSKFWQLKQVHVGDTNEKAAAEYHDAFMWYYEIKHNRIMFGYPPGDKSYDYFLQHKSMLVGSSDYVAESLQEYKEYTSVQNVICWFNCGGQPQQQTLDSMERFAAEVIPVAGSARVAN